MFSSLFLAFRGQGRVMDLCMTKHTVFEGSAAQSVGPDPQKLAKACDLMWQGLEYGLTTAVERPEW